MDKEYVDNSEVDWNINFRRLPLMTFWATDTWLPGMDKTTVRQSQKAIHDQVGYSFSNKNLNYWTIPAALVITLEPQRITSKWKLIHPCSST